MQGNILVAEDELLPRKNICRVLEDEGYIKFMKPPTGTRQ